MAKIKICLDAGHYGKYNQSPANKAYYESVMVWKLHLKLKAELEKYGFEVITTRPKQAENRGLESRGQASKGCDLFVSIHSNAVGNYVKESVDYPVAYVCLDGKADVIGKKLADCVQETMGTTQNGRISKRVNDSGKDYYGVIRGAASVGTPALILENSFHTNTKSTNWLLVDANLSKLAKKQAAVLAEYYGLTKNETVYNVSYMVRIDVSEIYDKCLNIREKPDGNSKKTGCIIEDMSLTIIQEAKDVNGNLWGKLKSGVGWIRLSYTKRI